jgi:hypothetical protein
MKTKAGSPRTEEIKRVDNEKKSRIGRNSQIMAVTLETEVALAKFMSKFLYF